MAVSTMPKAFKVIEAGEKPAKKTTVQTMTCKPSSETVEKEENAPLPSVLTSPSSLFSWHHSIFSIRRDVLWGSVSFFAALVCIVFMVAWQAFSHGRSTLSNGSSEVFHFITHLKTGFNVSMTMTNLLSFDGIETRMTALILPKTKVFVDEDTPFEADVHLTYWEGNVQKTYVISNNRMHYTVTTKTKDSMGTIGEMRRATLGQDQLSDVWEVDFFTDVFRRRSAKVIEPENATLQSMDDVLNYIHRTGHDVIIEYEKSSLETKEQYCLKEVEIPPIHLLPLSLLHAEVLNPNEVPSTFQCPTTNHRIVSLLWSDETFLYCIDPTQDLTATTPPVTDVLGNNVFIHIQTLTMEGVQETKDKIAASFVNGQLESCPIFDFNLVGGLASDETRAMRDKKRHLLDAHEKAYRAWEYYRILKEWSIDDDATTDLPVEGHTLNRPRSSRPLRRRRRLTSRLVVEQPSVQATGFVTNQHGINAAGDLITNAPKCPPQARMNVNGGGGAGANFGRRLEEGKNVTATFARNDELHGFTEKPEELKVPCVYIHGSMMTEESDELWTSYKAYWGDVVASTDPPQPCFCSIKMFVKLNTLDYFAWEEAVAHKLFRLLKKAEPLGDLTDEVLDYMIILTHGSGKTMLLAALEWNKARLGTYTNWIALNPIESSSGTSWGDTQTILCSTTREAWADFVERKYHSYYFEPFYEKTIDAYLTILHGKFNETKIEKIDDDGVHALAKWYGWGPVQANDGTEAGQTLHAALLFYQALFPRAKLRWTYKESSRPIRLAHALRYRYANGAEVQLTTEAVYEYAVCAPGKLLDPPKGCIGETFSGGKASQMFLLETDRSEKLKGMLATAKINFQAENVACSGRYVGGGSAYHERNQHDISASITPFSGENDGRSTLEDCQADTPIMEFGELPKISRSLLSNVAYKDIKRPDSLWDVKRKLGKWLEHLRMKKET